MADPAAGAMDIGSIWHGEVAPPAPVAAAPARQRAAIAAPLRGWMARLAGWAMVSTIVISALIGGLQLRAWLWNWTDADGAPQYARFIYDIDNAFRWGTAVLHEGEPTWQQYLKGERATDWKHFLHGYVHLYDNVEAGHDDERYDLDYTPMRLLTVSLWVRHERIVFPNEVVWRRPYIFTAPLLRFNTLCSLLGALGAFVLVRLWVKRDIAAHAPPRPGENVPGPWDLLPLTRHSKGWICGLIAAILIWFNPGMLVDSHLWPQWDVWVLPFFLWAAVLASVDGWLWAGVLIAIGGMMKGQMLLVSPVLVLWALVGGRPLAALRFLVGVAVSATVMTCVWLVSGERAWLWVGGVMAAGALVGPWMKFSTGRLVRWPGSWWVMATVCAAAVLWPWMLRDDGHLSTGAWTMIACIAMAIGAGHWLNRFRLTSAKRRGWQMAATMLLAGAIGTILGKFTGAILGTAVLVMLVMLVIAMPRVISNRWTGTWLAAIFATAVFIASWRFAGDWAWYNIGFGYGVAKFEGLSMTGANLTHVLSNQPFGWQLKDIVWTMNIDWLHHWIHFSLPITMQGFLVSLFFASNLYFAIMAARYSRRGDVRWLICMVGPWVLMFALLSQMHERYLVWAGVLSAMLFAVSWRAGLLHGVVLFVAMLLTLPGVLLRDPIFLPRWTSFLRGFGPAQMWVVLLMALTYLYLAAKPRERDVGIIQTRSPAPAAIPSNN